MEMRANVNALISRPWVETAIYECHYSCLCHHLIHRSLKFPLLALSTNANYMTQCPLFHEWLADQQHNLSTQTISMINLKPAAGNCVISSMFFFPLPPHHQLCHLTSLLTLLYVISNVQMLHYLGENQQPLFVSMKATSEKKLWFHGGHDLLLTKVPMLITVDCPLLPLKER